MYGVSDSTPSLASRVLAHLVIATARWSAVLLRLAYLGVTNAFALLRLLPMSDRDKDVEILALRHQLTVLERQR